MYIEECLIKNKNFQCTRGQIETTSIVHF